MDPGPRLVTGVPVGPNRFSVAITSQRRLVFDMRKGESAGFASPTVNRRAGLRDVARVRPQRARTDDRRDPALAS